ncbi:MAG: cell division protein FtsZ [Paramuribaculum sp.]|nr:cell division protein FtsZ [Paramuribaculum sp.]
MEPLNIDSLADSFKVNEEITKNKNIIKVIGVGGGGNNAVAHMYRQNIKDVSFVVLNTDKQALLNSPVPDKTMIGTGLGAGNKPEKAREAAENDIEKIRAIFDDDTCMVFITAGMGGGTGTGAAPIVAREAKAKNILTVGIVTIPFRFEGDKKILKALDGVDRMAEHVDALLVINNERLTEIYGDLDFLNAFGKADDTLAVAASSISEIITSDGYMNLDFHDVDTTLRNGGAAIISSGFGEGENRVTKAIEDALNSPLLKNRDIETSKRLLFNIYYSTKAEQAFKMSEAQEITDFVSRINPDVDVIWGVCFDDSLGEKVRITILAAGFDVTIREEEDEIIHMGNRQSSLPAADKKSGGKIVFEGDRSKQAAKTSTAATGATGNPDRVTDLYGDKYNYIILEPSQMDNDMVLEQLERTPTYTRTRKEAEVRALTAEPETPQTPVAEAVKPGNQISF